MKLFSRFSFLNFLIVLLTSVQTHAQQVVVAGTDFTASPGKQGEYYIDADGIDQYGVSVATLTPGPDWHSGLLSTFNSKYQYLIINNPVKIDSTLFLDRTPDYMFVVSPPTTSPSTIFEYNVSDMVPGSTASVTIEFCGVIDPVKTGQLQGYYCTGQQTGFKLNVGPNGGAGSIDRDYTINVGACSTVTITDAVVDASGQLSVKLSAIRTGACVPLGISKIEVKGEIQAQGISEQGEEVCAGEQITLKPKVAYAGDYKWQVFESGSWRDLGTNMAQSYETKLEGNYRFRFLLTPASGPVITSEEVIVSAIKCCTAANGAALSRQTIFYDDFGTLTDLTGRNYKVWDYTTDPTNPVQVPRTTTTPFRWAAQSDPPGTFVGTQGEPIVDGEYTIAAYLTNTQPYRGVRGAALGWAGDILGPVNSPPIAYDHSGTLEGAALLINNPFNSRGSVVYKREISNLCTTNGTTIYFECYITVFTKSVNGVDVSVRLTGGAQPVTLNGVACRSGAATAVCSNPGRWVRIAGSVVLTGNTLTMEVINNAPNEWNQAGNDLVIDDIKIMSCAPPALDLVFDVPTLSTAEEVCNEMDIIALPTENLKKYYNDAPKYLYQWTTTPENFKSWKNIGGVQDGVTKVIPDPKALKSPAFQNGDKIYFRVVAAATAATLEATTEFNINNPCRNYSVSDPIEATVKCPSCNQPTDVTIAGAKVVTVPNKIKTATICEDSSTVLRGTYTKGTEASMPTNVYSYSWYKEGATPVYAAIPAGGAVPNKTVSEAGKWILRIEDYNGTAPSASCYLEDTVEVVITPKPVAPTVKDTAYCLNQTATPVTAKVTTGSSNVLTWYDAATAGEKLTGAALTPSTATAGDPAKSYWVTQKTPPASGGCEGPRARVDIEVVDLPAAPAGKDTTYCQDATARPLKAAVTAGSGNVLTWYSDAAKTTVLTGAALTPSTATAGDKKYYVTQKLAAAPGCESPVDEVTITVTPKPARPAATRPVSFCEDGTAPAWTATAAAGNSLLWYTDSLTGTGAAARPAIPNTPAGLKKIFVSQKTPAASGGCESDRTRIAVHVKKKLSANTISDDQTICLGDAVTAIGGAAAQGQLAVAPNASYKWKSSTTTGTGFTDIASATGLNYTPTGLRQTTYFIREAQADSGFCANLPSNEIKITILRPFRGNAITTTTPVICSGNAPAITGNDTTGVGATYEWEQATASAGPWTAVSNGTTKDMPSLTLNNTNAGTTVSFYFRRKVKVGNCESISDPVKIDVSGGMTAGTIGTDQTICKDGTIPAKLTSTAPATGGTSPTIEYEWESSSNGSTGWTSLGAKSATNLEYTPATAPTADIYFRRKAYAGTGLCDNATTTPVKITVVTPPVATIRLPKVVESPDTDNHTFNEEVLDIKADAVTAGYTGEWSLAPKGTLGSAVDEEINTVKDMAYDESSVLIWEVSDNTGKCPAAKATLNIERKNITVADVRDDSLCISGLPLTVPGNGLITNETSSWRFVSATPNVTPTWRVDPGNSKNIIIDAVSIPSMAGKVELVFEYTVESQLSTTGPSKDLAKITIYELTEPASTTPINTCADRERLTGNQPQQPTASGKWRIDNGQGALENENLYNSLLTGLDDMGITNLTWKISNHLCPADSATLVVDQKGKSTPARISITGGRFTSPTEITDSLNVALCAGVDYSFDAILPSTGLKAGEIAAWSNTGIPAATGSSSPVLYTPASEGASSITWTITPPIVGCDPTTTTATFKIGDVPKLDPITGPDSVCELTSGIYNVPLKSGAGVNTLPVASYKWSPVTGVPSATATATVIGDDNQSSAQFDFASSLTTGASDLATIRVDVTNACGVSTEDSVIAIKLKPRDFTGDITGKDTICASSQDLETYQVATQSNTTIYNWYVGTLLLNNVTQPATSADIASQSLSDQAPEATIKVVLENGCGTGVDKSMKVVITPAEPVIVTLTGTESLCLPTFSGTYTGASPNAGAGATYNFTILHPDGTTGLTQSSTTKTTFDVGQGDLKDGSQIRLQVIGNPQTGCFTDGGVEEADPLRIDGYQFPDSVLTGADTVCAGTGILLKIDESQGKGVQSYKWFKNNTLISNISNTVSLSNSWESGVYTVEISNKECTSTSDPANVKIHDVPVVNIVPNEIMIELAVTPQVTLSAVVTNLVTDTTLTIVDWSGPNLSDTDDSLKKVVTPPAKGGILEYNLTVATGDSIKCPATAYAIVRALPAVDPPTGFTPNGDGLNDTWHIRGLEAYPNAQVALYNRWGGQVFRSSPYGPGNEWDGRTSGGEIATGTYYWVIDLGVDTMHQKRYMDGHVTVIR